ncbi:MAG: AMP-binding protein [Actinomycetota bacterium]
MVAPTSLQPTPTHPFTGRDVPWLLATQVAQRPQHPFLVWEPFEGEGATWTYEQFAHAVARFAAGLEARGVRQGHSVVIHLGNCPEFLIAWFACSHLGAIAVTTNTRSTADELAYFIGNCGAEVVITQPALRAAIVDSGAPLRLLIVTDTDQGAAPERLNFDELKFVEVESGAGEAVRSDALAPNSVQYTSGTTARPKGVVWTHANALWAAKTGASLLELGPDDITLVFLPLFHTNALSYSMLSTLWSGGTVVVQPRFSASRYWDAVVRNGCTWTSSIPFMFWALMEQPKPDAHRLRYWGLGASDVGLVQQQWGIRTLGWFGMTETVTLCIMAEIDKPNRRMAMGVPVAGYDVKVVRDDGTPVDFGESGWLKIRGIPGISLFLEYLGNPEATAEAFDTDGWFDTGDLVTPFDDGHIRFDNRGKDMLRVGAENVSAAEVERVIASVMGVKESAVVGRKDKMLDEVPVAFVIPFGDTTGLADRIIAACAEQLASFKVPREVILVDDLPRVTLEKVDKKTLRKQLDDARSQ